MTRNPSGGQIDRQTNRVRVSLFASFLFHIDQAAPPSGYGISGRCSADAPFVPTPDGSAPLAFAASGETPDGLRATRKPMLFERCVGTFV